MAAANPILSAMQDFADTFHSIGIGAVNRQVLFVQMGLQSGSALNLAAIKVKQVMKAAKAKLHHYDYQDGKACFVGPRRDMMDTYSLKTD